MKADFITNFFREIEKRQIEYCILRNYDGLPEKSGRDIDILMDPVEGYKDTKLIVEKIITSLNWKFVCSRIDDMFVTYICYNFDKSGVHTIQLDIWMELKWRGIRWIDTELILKSRRQNENGFYIPAPESEAAVTGLKELMGGRAIPSKYYFRISMLCNKDRDNFISLLQDTFPNSATWIADAFIEGRFDVVDNNAKNIRRDLIQKKRRTYLRSSFGRFRNKIKKIIKPDGKLIAFIGPDGSGKTTVLDEQARLFQPFFSGTKKFHIRMGIFPELKTGLGLSSMKGEVNRHYSKPGDKPLKKRTLLSKLASWIVIFYYLMEFFIGRLIIRRHNLSNKLILFDRYFYDYFAQPATRNLIWPFKKLLLIFVRSPDLIIHLDADPQVVYLRKQELQIEEIETQNIYLHKFVSEMGNAYSINTDDKPVPEINSEVFRLIVDQLFDRCS